MSWFRDEADVSMPLTDRLEIGQNSQQSCVLSAGTWVGLERYLIKFSYWFQIGSKRFNNLEIPLSLAVRHEGMQVQFRPGNRSHLWSSVEFHGAASQRYHRSIQSDVLLLQASQISHHLTFWVNRLENLLIHKGISSQKLLVQWNTAWSETLDIYFWLLSELSQHSAYLSEIFLFSYFTEW